MNEEPIEPKQSTPAKSHIIQTLAIPVAIVIAGALIAGAVLFSLKGSGNVQDTIVAQKAPTVAEDPSKQLENLKPISADDHIRGNSDAPIKLAIFGSSVGSRRLFDSVIS